MNYRIKEIIENKEHGILLLDSSSEIYDDIARQMADKLKKNNSMAASTIFILPVGPRGQYRRFARICNNEMISCKNLITINMDEFLDDDDNYISGSSPYSFRKFMQANLFSLLADDVKIRPENIIFPDPGNPEQIFELLKDAGGSDICFAGVGINGHVAFNEPVDAGIITIVEFKKLKTRILNISRETRIMTSLKHGGYIEGVPGKAITIGMAEILMSKEIRVYLEHPYQAAALERLVFSDPTPEFPVTILKEHPGFNLTISREVLDSYIR